MVSASSTLKVAPVTILAADGGAIEIKYTAARSPAP